MVFIVVIAIMELGMLLITFSLFGNNQPKMNTDVRWEYELRGISYE